MGTAIFSAASGAKAQARYLDIIANNLANVGTTGYKADDLTFSDYLVKESNAPGKASVLPSENAPASTNIDQRLQSFVNIDSQYIDFSQGVHRQTSNPLDVAIDGEGFFRIEKDNQFFYTRDGSFHTNGEGELLHSSGGMVLDDSGRPITLGEGVLSIDDKGVLFQQDSEVARLGVYEIPRSDELMKAGRSLLKYMAERQAPPIEAEDSSVIQGALEKSNVNPIREMTKMIKVNRHFELMNKVVKAYQDLDRQSIQEVGETSR